MQKGQKGLAEVRKVLCNESRMKEQGMYSLDPSDTPPKFMTDLISHGGRDGWEI